MTAFKKGFIKSISIFFLMCTGTHASSDLVQKEDVAKFVSFMERTEKKDIFFNYLLNLKNDNLTVKLDDSKNILELPHRMYTIEEIAKKINTLETFPKRYKMLKAPAKVALENMGYPVNPENLNEMSRAFIRLGVKLADKEK